MDYSWSAEDLAFRAELKQFIAEMLPADWTGYAEDSGLQDGIAAKVADEMGKRRWLVLPWPAEYGGLSASFWQQMIFKEETGYHRVPGIAYLAVSSIGPSIMIYGNDAQKKKYLPGIASGELTFCQMFTEPGTGSDLASLQTQAVLDGDSYVINGTKIFTSGAHRSDYGWLAARTDPDAPKHRGISTFVIPVKSPGITVVPLINVNNELGLNQVFFDNVRLPRTELIGQENRGWYQIMTTLEFERSGMERWAPAKRLMDELVEYARSERAPGKPGLSPQQRYKIADMYVMSEVGHQLAYRICDMQTRGVAFNHEPSMSKTFNAHLYQGLAQLGMNVLGMYGPLRPGSKWVKLRGLFEHQYLGTIPTTISGGTVEINRNIIATRGLGLPRS